jgi:uncharacterized protein YjiS (DUF1127 family)
MRFFAESGSAALGQSAPASAFAAAAKQVWNTVSGPVRAYVQRETVYRELAELDDRMLADIGLNRSDVYAVASGIHGGGPLSQPKLNPGD